MIEQIYSYFTIEMLYFWVNIGVIPFWLLLITIPNSKITGILVNSILIPLILSSLYVYLGYQMIVADENLINIFNLYLGIDYLYSLLSSESFLVFFWLHFLALNIFLGSWVTKDSLKYNVSRYITIISLVLCYFCGPVGLVFYWLFRIFFSKKISIHD